MISQEMKLAETFVELADTLVDDFDVIDFLHTLCARSSEIFNAEGAGLLLSSQRGDLQVLAATDEQTRQLELFQLEENTGPCLDCYYQEKIVVANDADELTRRWPTFAPRALDAGFVSVCAVPMRLRGEVLGGLNVFSRRQAALDENARALAQAMADIATISLVNQRSLSEAKTLAEQLQGALTSRVIIEQAKGVVAERYGLGMDEAFAALRRHARSNNLRLSHVATQVTNGDLEIGRLGHE